LLPAPAWLAGSAYSARERDRVLVLVQLRGGNDGLNTVVPRDDDRYYRARPDLAIPRDQLLALDALNGLHPSLTRMARRFAGGQLRILQGVGYPGPNLSHFRSQDIWDAASVAQPLPDRGWMGEFCDHELAADASPLAMLALGRDVMPRAMRAGRSLACAVPSLERYRIRTVPQGADEAEAQARWRAIEALNAPTGDPRLAHLAGAVRAARDSIDELAQTAQVSSMAAYPDTKLGSDLALAARVIVAGLPARFIYLTQDGYDTHAHQTLTLQRLLGDLDAGLDAFLKDLTAHGALDRVLLMTISDFGRRVAQSGLGASVGSDHGAASVQFLAGGHVLPGLIGDQPDLEHLDADGNLVHCVDFRQVYAGVIEDWLGGNARAALGAHFEKVAVVS